MHHESKCRWDIVEIAQTAVELVVKEKLLVGYTGADMAEQLAVAVKTHLAHQTVD